MSNNLVEVFTTSNITFVLGLIGVIFSIYNSYRNPQVDLDKRTAVEREEVDGKATLLAQQVQRQKESTDKRLAEVAQDNKDALILATNHIHTLDTKIDNVQATMSMMQSEIVKLATIINERVPQKT